MACDTIEIMQYPRHVPSKSMIVDIFQVMLNPGVVMYLDNLLIYSKLHKEHKKLQKEVLSRLKNNHLQGNLTKSEFEIDEVEFIKYIISAQHCNRGLVIELTEN